MNTTTTEAPLTVRAAEWLPNLARIVADAEAVQMAMVDEMREAKAETKGTAQAWADGRTRAEVVVQINRLIPMTDTPVELKRQTFPELVAALADVHNARACADIERRTQRHTATILWGVLHDAQEAAKRADDTKAEVNLLDRRAVERMIEAREADIQIVRAMRTLDGRLDGVDFHDTDTISFELMRTAFQLLDGRHTHTITNVAPAAARFADMLHQHADGQRRRTTGEAR